MADDPRPPGLPGLAPESRDGEFDTGFPVAGERPELDVYRAPTDRAPAAPPAPPAEPPPPAEAPPAGPPAADRRERLPDGGDRGAGTSRPPRRPLFAAAAEPEHVPAGERGVQDPGSSDEAPDSAFADEEVREQRRQAGLRAIANSQREEAARRASPALPAAPAPPEAQQQPRPAPSSPVPAVPPRAAPPPGRDERFTRADVYAHPVEGGRELSDGPWQRAWEGVVDLLTPRSHKEEESLDRQLRALRRVSRTNLIVSLSPKGGVGKTTCTFLAGSLLASHCKLRTLIVDANPQWGTLASLAPDLVRTDLSLSDLLANLDDVDSAAALQPYISPLATGCHLLGAPTDPAVMGQLGPEEYMRLLTFLSRYYETILLDLGTGVVDPLAQAAIRAADQALLVTTPEYVTTAKVIGVVGYLGNARDPNLGEDAAAPPEQVLTVVLNKAPREGSGDRQQIEAAFRRQQVGKAVIVPHDDRLRVMLDSATFSLDELPRKTRLAIKRLGLSVAQDLV